MKALLLVDIQNDFLPGGALAIKDANQIIPLVASLVTYPFDLIIATKDWHPADHGSFASQYQKKPGEQVNLDGIEQILWPDHCVQNSWGAEFAPGWDTTRINKIIYKGIDPLIDSYSTFFDNGQKRKTALHAYLTQQRISHLFVAGLATDYCVKYSVLDALELGFQTTIIVDACRGVNLKPTDDLLALQLLASAGALLTTFKDLRLHHSLVKTVPKL